MSTRSYRSLDLSRAAVAATALTLAAGCGQPLDSAPAAPQNESLPNAPAGILVVGPEAELPPGVTLQSLTSSEQSAALAAVNAVRVKGTSCGGTPYPAATALGLEARLVKAGEGHALDMASHNYFSHTGLDGSQPWDRVTRTGYTWSTVGENIAAGYATIADTVAGWYKSTGHCQNFMNKSFTQVGFGKATSASSTYKNYWVAVLAKPR